MNIVFDIGNVLLHWDPRALYRKVFTSEAEVDWFLANVCTSAWNQEQDRGRSFAEAVAEATARHPEHAEAIAAYDTRWHETLTHVIEGTVDILEELKAQGTPLYAITNWHQDKFRETRARFGFLGHFRDIVVSGDERLIEARPCDLPASAGPKWPGSGPVPVHRRQREECGGRRGRGHEGASLHVS